MKTILLWLAAIFLAVNASAASYGPYPGETYQTCGPSNAPVAVELIHGGAWASGNYDASQTQTLCRYLGANGIYVISVNYRLSGVAPWPAQLQDVQLGLRYLRLITTAKRIGVIGTSAGGHIALSVGEASGTVQFATTDSVREASMLPGVSDRPDFVVDISGPTDLTDPKLLPGDVAVLVRGLGMNPTAARAFASPIAHLTSDIPPILISHGVQDTTVPVGQSDEFVRAARPAGIPLTSVNTGSGNAVAALSGITYDRHPGGHALSVAPAVQAAMLRMILQFSKGTQQ
jgi:acetyl esterase/lipase